MRPLSVLEAIDDCVIQLPTREGRDVWLRLDSLLAEVFERDDDLTPAAEPLLRIFERLRIPGYEHALIASVQRCPTDLTVTMLRRLRKSGTKTVGDVDVEALIAWGSARAPEINWTL